jgi:hypothetical protein
LVIEGATVGPVVSRRNSNIDGIPSISVTTLQDKDGNSIIGSGENLVHTYDRLLPFTYPGEVGITQDRVRFSGASGLPPSDVLNYELEPPVEATIKAKINVIFQSSNDIVAGDFTYDTAVGYWNPITWARGRVVGRSTSGIPFSKSQAFRGYRTNNDKTAIIPKAALGTTVSVSNRVVIFRSDDTFLQALNNADQDLNAIETGTAQGDGGGDNTIQLAATASATNGFYDNALIEIVGGTGAGQSVRIVSYVGATKTATVLLDWEDIEADVTTGGAWVKPDNTSEYRIVPQFYNENTGEVDEFLRVVGQGGNVFTFVDGVGMATGVPYRIDVSGGPENPRGKKWVLDVDLRVAFEDIDGNTYYKKTIVTADL